MIHLRKWRKIELIRLQIPEIITQDLVFAFGLVNTVRIYESAFRGSLKEIPLFRTTERNKKMRALKKFCLYYRPKHSIVIDAEITDKDRQFKDATFMKKFVAGYKRKIGFCDLKYHGSLNYEQTIYPNIPFASVVVRSEEQLSYVSEHLHNLERIDTSHFGHSLFAIMRANNIRHLRAYLLNSNSEHFFNTLLQEDNNLETLIIIDDIRNPLTEVSYEHLLSFISSEKFKIKELHLYMQRSFSSGKLERLIDAAKSKVEKIGISTYHASSNINQIITSADSKITKLELSCMIYLTICLENNLQSAELLVNLLTAKTNKITELTLEKQTRLPFEALTRILQNPNNKLRRLYVLHPNSLRYDGHKVQGDFVEALKSSTCHVKYLQLSVPAAPSSELAENFNWYERMNEIKHKIRFSL